jgi:uncharacterized protein
MIHFIPFYPYPVLILENSNKEKYLIITDIHIGFEDEIIRKGVFIDPKKNVEEIIELLSTIIYKTQIKNLIILGDLKSSKTVITKSEWNNVPFFLKSLSKLCNIYLIPGNHDGNIIHLVPKDINMMSTKGMEINNTLLTHGHALPSIGKNIDKIITGHLHPILIKEGSILNGQKVWIRIILKKKEIGNLDRKIEFIIVPHFNQYSYYYENYIYGKKINSKKNKLPLLNNLITKKEWEMVQVFFISLDGAIIGSEHELNEIL